MKMRRFWKRCLLAGLVPVMLWGMLAGCGKKEEQQQEKAMGRYLEEVIPMPEGMGMIACVEEMEDGSLWIGGNSRYDYVSVFSTKDSGKTWERVWGLEDKELDPGKYASVWNMDFTKQGDTLINVWEFGEDGNGTGSVLLADKEGKMTALVEGIDSAKKEFIGEVYFDSRGNAAVGITMEGVRYFSTESGEELYRIPGNYFGIGVAGNILIAFEDGTEIRYFDLKTGKPLEEDAALSSQLKKNLKWTGVSPVAFTEGEEEGSLFVCDRGGIYSHSFGGNLVEQVMDASLNTLGAVEDGYVGMARGKEHDFYIIKGGQDNCLMHYVYDPDIPTVPDKELKVYALSEYPELRQAAFQYQKENPDVRIVIETAMDDIPQNSSSTDGYLDTRRSDALKNLNTEILAGKGPDVLVLDDMPMEAYIEKGILKDISGILKKNRNILDNIKEAYTTEDGKIYGIPARVQLPVIFGERKELEGEMNLSKLAGIAELEGKSLAEGETVYPYYSPGELAEIFMNAYAYEWQKNDGTLEETEVRAFLEQLFKLYHADTEEKQQEQSGFGGIALDIGIGPSLPKVYGGQAKMAFGGIGSANTLEFTESIIRRKTEYTWRCLAEGAFLPRMTLGVSTKGKNQDLAEDFIGYLMGEAAQKIQQGNGFSVNQEVLKDKEYWGIPEDTEQPKNRMAFRVTPEQNEYLDIYAVNEEQLRQMQGILASLDKPYALDIQVKSLIKGEVRAYLKEKETLDEAMKNLMDKVNLYLAE